MLVMNRRQRDVTVKCVGFLICFLALLAIYQYLKVPPSVDVDDYDNPFVVPLEKEEDTESFFKLPQKLKNVIEKVMPVETEVTVQPVSLPERYRSNWESLDKRPLPSWYDEAKIGIFIHWGVYSVPSFKSEWFWWNWKGAGAKYKKETVAYMNHFYRPNFTYADFAAQFTAEFFDPVEWAETFKKAGAKYVVFTSKHHEGYTNWPSEYSFSWNSRAVGPKKDLVGELSAAVKGKDLKFGLYHSLYEWFHPLYLRDKRNKFKTRYFVEAKTMPELYELVNIYKPDIVWSDGEWDAEDTYWNSTEFIAWLYNDSPVREDVVTNDRWGKNVRCKHGSFFDCQDRFNPGTLQKKKWENCMTIDKKSWGFRRDASLEDYYTVEEMLKILVETISCGGNILINIGPAHDGTIATIYLERLKQLGQWLDVNGEAIYSSIPWTYQKDNRNDDVWYTKKINGTVSQTIVYAIVLKWPTDNKLFIGAPVPSFSTVVTLLGYNKPMNWTSGADEGIIINIPYISYKQIPCKWTWVFKMTALKNS